jgi:hypothetical protein
MPSRGFLAIFSDIAPADEADYVAWLTREHAAERVGTPGFRGVRVFRARAGDARRYFILYALDGPEVLGGPAYLARLAAPTPWTHRIMPRLGNFVRGGGCRVATAGLGMGGVVSPFLMDAALSADEARGLADALAARADVIAASVFVVDRDGTDVATSERALRGGDKSFEALLLVEALDEDYLASVTRDAALGRCAGRFSAFFSLEAADLPADAAISKT